MAAESPADETMVGAIVRNPVVQTLGVMTLVSVATWAATIVGLGRLFVLAIPIESRPWALVTSVYAHLGPGHLFANAVMIALAGGIVVWSTTAIRFHLFFVATGAIAGAVQVVVAYAMGTPLAVLGSSGAAFALVGYVLTSNSISQVVTGWLNLSARVVIIVVAIIATWLTVEWSAPGSALLAHFTGAVLGLAAGHIRLLHTP
ncbi:rhomboid family intramembrane serine protease [Halobellus rubicundus]|uniref:Rhomboid family intramembrane serine protease n=1 Tax=Halobellus rubicundus TaxID=2996466 RepID=A0ABD5MFK4_9EURY